MALLSGGSALLVATAATIVLATLSQHTPPVCGLPGCWPDGATGAEEVSLLQLPPQGGRRSSWANGGESFSLAQSAGGSAKGAPSPSPAGHGNAAQSPSSAEKHALANLTAAVDALVLASEAAKTRMSGIVRVYDSVEGATANLTHLSNLLSMANPNVAMQGLKEAVNSTWLDSQGLDQMLTHVASNATFFGHLVGRLADSLAAVKSAQDSEEYGVNQVEQYILEALKWIAHIPEGDSMETDVTKAEEALEMALLWSGSAPESGNVTWQKYETVMPSLVTAHSYVQYVLGDLEQRRRASENGASGSGEVDTSGRQKLGAAAEAARSRTG